MMIIIGFLFAVTFSGRKSRPGHPLTTLLLISPFFLVVMIFAFAVVGIVTYGGRRSLDTSNGFESHATVTLKNITLRSMRSDTTLGITTTVVTTTLGPYPTLLCVLGHNLAVMHQTWDFYCNYIVYPDVTATPNGFVGPDGPYAWNLFFNATRSMPDFLPGVAFSAVDASHPNSTVARIPSMRKALDAMVSKKVVAMGVLNFTSDTSHSTAVFKTLFEVLNETLHGRQGALTFLGVRLHSMQDARNFAADVHGLTGLDCVVLQTHLSDAVTVTESCFAHLVSYKYTADPVPCFAHALEAVSALNNASSELLVMFSSTLAAVDYVGASGAPGPTAPGQDCESNLALDVDIVCNTSARQSYRTDPYDVVEVARYNVDVFAHFASFESKDTLAKKMDTYLNYTSGGWAVFDIQRDVSAWCLSPDPYHRLQAMAAKLLEVRHRAG
ncbi:uncharacterized protein [Dermacentor albipictus]